MVEFYQKGIEGGQRGGRRGDRAAMDGCDWNAAGGGAILSLTFYFVVA